MQERCSSNLKKVSLLKRRCLSRASLQWPWQHVVSWGPLLQAMPLAPGQAWFKWTASHLSLPETWEVVAGVVWDATVATSRIKVMISLSSWPLFDIEYFVDMIFNAGMCLCGICTGIWGYTCSCTGSGGRIHARVVRFDDDGMLCCVRCFNVAYLWNQWINFLSSRFILGLYVIVLK